MTSDHLSFVYEMTYAMNENGVLSDADKKKVLANLTRAGNILDAAEREVM